MRFHRTVAAVFSGLLLFASCSKEKPLNEGIELSCVQPPFLSPGDTVALLSPSYYTPMENVYAAERVLRNWGFVPVIGPNVGKQYRGNYGGTPQERLSDLRWALEDPSVKAIICNRGGYGTIRFVDMIPPEMMGSHPKWLVGFSDITTLHEIENVSGVMSIHGTMGSFLAKSDGVDPSSQLMRDLLTGTLPYYVVPPHKENIKGKASGVLVGGNLCTFTPILGSSADALRGKDIILFIEEVEEDMSHIDRLVNMLVINGVFDRCKGVILGEFTDCKANLGFDSVEQMICSYLKRYGIPVCCGFPGGHGDVNLPLVMGSVVDMEVNGSGATLSFRMDGNIQRIDTAKEHSSYSTGEDWDAYDWDKPSRLVRQLDFAKYYDGVSPIFLKSRFRDDENDDFPVLSAQDSLEMETDSMEIKDPVIPTVE